MDRQRRLSQGRQQAEECDHQFLAASHVADRRRLRNGEWDHRLWLPGLLWGKGSTVRHGLAFAAQIWSTVDQFLSGKQCDHLLLRGTEFADLSRARTTP